MLACIVTGAAAGYLVWLAVPAGWDAAAWMPAGMALGMALGMTAGVIGGILFTPLFGAMEISMPAGLSGMVAGMAVGMLWPMAGIGEAAAAGIGAALGLACLAYAYLRNAGARGVVE